MKTIVSFILILITISIQAQQINITPKPVSVTINNGSYEITPQTKIFLAKPGLKNSADFFNDYLQKFYGFKLAVVAKPTGNFIEFTTEPKTNHADSYALKVDNKHAKIIGANEKGVFYGMQTLIQLLPLEKFSSLKNSCSDD